MMSMDYSKKQKQKYKELNRRLMQYVAMVNQIYQSYNEEASRIAMTTGYNSDSEGDFKFSDYPKTKYSIEKLQRNFADNMQALIYSGISKEWKNSNDAQDLLANEILKKYKGQVNGEKQKIIYQTNSDAMKAFANRTDKGLDLSDKVWKQSDEYVRALEAAISTAISKGTSAVTLSKQISKYLIDFDKLQKDYKSQFGQATDIHDCEYRSARLARSEINMAYRTAEQTRWNEMDFVRGYRIELSNNHSDRRKKHGEYSDICDELQGDYPKDFKWTGWHPNCRCHAVPLLMSEEDFIRWNNGESVDKNLIKDVPENYKRWAAENADKIEQAGARGTQPYFVRDNKKYMQSTEQLKQYALLKKQSGNILNVAKDYGEVDWTELGDILQNVNSKQFYSNSDMTALKTKMQSVIGQIQQQKAAENSLSDIIPDVHQWHKQVTLAELEQVHKAVSAKLNQLATLPLEKQATKLDFEANEFLAKNMNNVQAKFPKTWRIAQSAYLKKLDEVKSTIALNNVKTQLDAVAKWSAQHPKSAKVASLLSEANKAISNGESIAVIEQKANLATAEYQKRLAEQARRDAKKGNIVFPEMDNKTIQNLLGEYETNTISNMDKALRPITESVLATLTDEEKLVLTKYTQTYSYLNEPLRGLIYSGWHSKDEYAKDLPILTSALNKFQTIKNMVVRRGVKNFYIPEIGKDLNMISVGEEFTDGGFLSTAVHRNGGFKEQINMVIIVPKGARGAFAEPFSHFTDSHKFSYDTKNLWDGKSVETMQNELEWIGQRGSRLKVIEKSGNTIYLQLIGQLR